MVENHFKENNIEIENLDSGSNKKENINKLSNDSHDSLKLKPIRKKP